MVIFPGSFDPFTIGHQDIVNRALQLFDGVIIAVGENIEKQSLLSTSAKMELIGDLFAEEPCVQVISYSGLTTDLCRRLKVNNLLRGVRTIRDFEYESTIDSINRLLNPDIETIILLTSPEYSAISSTAIREIRHHGGQIDKLMPKGIDLEKYITK